VNLEELERKFNIRCAAYLEPGPSDKKSELVSESAIEKQLKTVSAHLAKLQQKEANAKRPGSAKATDLQASKRKKSGGGDRAGGSEAARARVPCSFCHETTHEQKNCYSDPNAPEEVKKRAAAHKLRTPGWEPLPR